MKMIRTFYPIGQGAFYTEKHDDKINVVYDCGSKSAKNKVDKKIKDAFESEEVIDLLFISHYDEDHINKIHLLLESNTIRNVVLPLLHKDDRILLYNFYVSLGFNQVASLLNNPGDFFGGDTKIFFVQPSDDVKDSNDDNVINLKELNSRNEPLLKSKIRIKVNECWEYIPDNHSYSLKRKEFIDLLNIYGVDIEMLSADINYGLKNKNIIKKIYKEISGNINMNSLILYSGPTENVRSNFKFPSLLYPFYHRFFDKRVACIFTGDSNFNDVDITTVFMDKWDLVGTVQIPHHGSKKDFNDNFLLIHCPMICPISFGNENSYGHPSIKAIETIVDNYSIPKLITENTETLYVQIIKYRNKP